jgi:hypothetical protein
MVRRFAGQRSWHRIIAAGRRITYRTLVLVFVSVCPLDPGRWCWRRCPGATNSR